MPVAVCTTTLADKWLSSLLSSPASIRVLVPSIIYYVNDASSSSHYSLAKSLRAPQHPFAGPISPASPPPCAPQFTQFPFPTSRHPPHSDPRPLHVDIFLQHLQARRQAAPHGALDDQRDRISHALRAPLLSVLYRFPSLGDRG